MTPEPKPPGPLVLDGLCAKRTLNTVQYLKTLLEEDYFVTCKNHRNQTPVSVNAFFYRNTDKDHLCTFSSSLDLDCPPCVEGEVPSWQHYWEVVATLRGGA